MPTEGNDYLNEDNPVARLAAPVMPAACEARNLKSLLNGIADQIADADRRHSEVLGSMHDRLTDLVRGTAAARSSVANWCEDRTPEATASRQEPASGPSSGSGLDDALAFESAAYFSEPAEAPAPLRSATGGGVDGSFTRKDDIDGGVDPFDVVGAELRDDDPWDRASADALMRVCESEGLLPVVDAPVREASAMAASGNEAHPAMPVPAAAGAAAGSAMSLAAAAAAMMSTPIPATAKDDIERAWLEAKFADVAGKLEQSIEILRAEGAVGVLEQRLDQLEAKLGAALSDTATRGDLAELKTIATQVEDLGQQIGEVQSNFARLGGIEAELRLLGEHVSDERMAKLMLAAAQPVPAPEDFASAVAEQVMSQLPHGAAGAEEAQHIGELRALIHDFITEQRQGEEHTATMLDTMQQAMIRLLDRMDAIEDGAHKSFQFPSHAYSDEATGMLVAEPEVQPVSEAVQPVAARSEPGPSIVNPAAAGQTKSEHESVSEAVAGAKARADVRPEPKRPQPQPIAVERNKEDFIAAARRAAKLAADAKAEPEAVALEEGQKAFVPAAKGAAKKVSGARSPSRLMVGIIAVLALAASFTVVNTGLRMMRPAAERVQVAPPSMIEQAPAIDRESEPAQGERDGTMRSGEKIPREIVPDGQPRKVADSGAIVDAAGMPTGIIVQNSAAITRPEHVARLEEQHQLATLSARLGASQLPAPVVPAAMVPDTAVLGNSVLPVTRQDQTGVSARTANEMPPAFIGPSSLRSAAAKGDASAEFEVGARFAEGKGLQQDLKQAVAWYQRSASQGFAQAQYRLATMYERGLGVKTDLARAKVWYERAAAQGTAKAMHNLAVLHTGRDGIPADYAIAAQWFAQAAAYGLVDSQFNLAVLYDGGLGVAKDVRQAYKWYALAGRAGDEEAQRRQEALRSKLSAADLAQVGAEVEGWRLQPIDAIANDPRMAGERWKVNLGANTN